MEMFSFSVERRVSIWSESSLAASSPLAATRAASSSAKATNSADLATKSVSQRSSTTEAASPLRTAVTAPSPASRSERLAAPARPFMRRMRAASSRSPPASSSAFLQSSMPAPVIWRRVDMSLAL